MTNPWLSRVGYIPYGERLSSPAAAPAPASPPSVTSIDPPPPGHRASRIWRRVQHGVVFTIFLGALAEIGFEGVIGRVWNGLHRLTPIPPTVTLGALAGVEVERYGSLPLAMRANPPEMAAVIKNLNEPGFRRFDLPLGSDFDGAAPVYALQARRGLEDSFGTFVQRGLDGIMLYALRIPAEWDSKKLEANRHKWAHWCGVNPDWIDRWSEFRQHKWSPKRFNDCRPGGRCLIVSPGCDKAILTDIDEQA